MVATWLASLGVQVVALESTAIYWKSPYAFLEQTGIATWVVNAHQVNDVPRSKTHRAVSESLAVLGRFGLDYGRFVPPKELPELLLGGTLPSLPWRPKRTADTKGSMTPVWSWVARSRMSTAPPRDG